MRGSFISIRYFLLASFLLLLEGMLWLFIGIPLRLWEKWCYTAQCLRYPPPPGGMYGNMARAYKEKNHANQRQGPHIL